MGKHAAAPAMRLSSPRLIDLAGKVFGRLTVLSRAPNLSGATMWQCRCACGRLKTVRSGSLRNGDTTNCGCASPKGTTVKQDRRREVEDLTGKRFGLLNVQKRSKKLVDKGGSTLWVCVCECGRENEVARSNLMTGRVKSCGCMGRGKRIDRNTINLSNRRFGHLVALVRVNSNHGENRRKNAPALWRCACKCGNICTVSSANLRNGNTRSCGCLRLPRPDAAFRGLLNSYKKAAKNRNRIFELTDSQFRDITSQGCFYCGAEPAQRFRGSKANSDHDYIYNGVDRLDNSKGYSTDNCVAACKTCNTMKATHAPAFFLSHTKKIHQNKSQKKMKTQCREKSNNQKIIEF